uniref:Uncharacterized protein n=1 Tax=Panagrolaimus davidi TaxID=227884 RepID=A0A914P4R6_9BILA
MNEEANAILLVPNNISCHYTKETLHELPKQYLTGRNLTKNEILDQALGQNSTYNSDNQEKFVSDENKKYYSDQKQVVKDQITKFEEDLIAYSFYKECDKVKDMLSQQMELINLEITIENIETMEKHLQNAESLIQLQAEPEMKSLTERAEKLFVSGFPKAKLEKNHIESLLIEEKQLLEDKRQEMQGMKELITFFESCDTVDKRIQMEIDIISNCNNNDQLNDHKNSINNFKEIISKLSETCDRINAKVYTKYANEMNGKIKYLQELNEDFISHHLKPKHLM